MTQGRTVSDYRVEIEGLGRTGTVWYFEGEERIGFWWEFTGAGAAIRVPSAEDWDFTCARDAPWSAGRRDEIVQRIGEEVRRQQVSYAELVYEDDWIVLRW